MGRNERDISHEEYGRDRKGGAEFHHRDEHLGRHVRKIENLGLVSGTDMEVNYVGLPEDATQWNENFTVDDYHELVRKIYDGEITIDNSTEKMPEVSVKVNERQGSIM